MVLVSNLVKTGISGLDGMLYGGIPEGNQVVLAGGPGSGKTLLSFEYLYRNARAGATSVFFALEEEPERVLDNARVAFKDFDDIDALIKRKTLVIDGKDPATVLHGGSSGGGSQYEFGKVLSEIESLIVSTKAKRIVIDSLSVLEMLIAEPAVYRRSMLSLAGNLRHLGVTSLLTAEMATPERSKLTFQTEFFVFDGIIVMYERGEEEEKRLLGMEVIKMRGAKHSFITTPYEITSEGINVVSTQDI